MKNFNKLSSLTVILPVIILASIAAGYFWYIPQEPPHYKEIMQRLRSGPTVEQVLSAHPGDFDNIGPEE